MPSSQETSTTIVRDVSDVRSSSVRNTRGASVSCSTQLTMMSCSPRKRGSGTRPCGVAAWLTRVVESSLSKWIMRTEWMGEATAATCRWVRTSTSFTPIALRAVTAPRAVAPNPMTTARSLGP